jgi:hypothetical protein
MVFYFSAWHSSRCLFICWSLKEKGGLGYSVLLRCYLR